MMLPDMLSFPPPSIINVKKYYISWNHGTNVLVYFPQILIQNIKFKL